MKKLLFTIFVATCLMLGSLSYAKASSLNLKVTIDNQNVNFTDSKPFAVNNRTMIPLRVISEQMGYTVGWVASTNSIELTKGNDKIDLKIGSNVIIVNGVPKSMDVSTVAVQNATYVPIKFVGDALGYDVTYDGNTQTVKLTKSLKITIDNQNISFTDNKPFVSNNRTMIPLRTVSEQMGYTVSWIPSTNSIELAKGYKKIDLKIGSSIILANGETVQMDIPTVAINNVTYIPVKFVGEALGYSVNYDGGTQTVQLKNTIYDLELTKWGVYNDGTHPVETTKGLNDAIQWTKTNGYATIDIPDGTYLISKDSSVKLISDTTIELEKNATFQKETNGYEQYAVVYVGPDVQNATIKGGTLIGDRYNHDYSQKDGAWSAGTHEWGYGVNVAGGKNVKIKNMTIKDMTGDGIYVGGSTMAGSYGIASTDLESGGIDDKGNLIAKDGKIRTKTFKDFSKVTDARFRLVNIWLPSGLTDNNYEVYYYDKDGNFLSKDTARVYSRDSYSPTNAYYYKIVFNAPTPTGVSMQMMNIANTENVVIENNDIGFNRRQGITLGGDNGLVLNNYIHDTSGASPQSGIDIEPGFFPARNNTVKENHFYNNVIQTVFSYGNGAVVDGNLFENGPLTGPGFHVHTGFNNLLVTNNKFIGSSMTLQNPNAIADGNVFIEGGASVSGDNSIFKNGTLTDSTLSVEGTGTVLSDSTITSTGTSTHLSSLTIGNKTLTVNNVKLMGTPTSMVTMGGYSSKDDVFTNLTLINVKSGATGMPSGTYNGGSFSYTGNNTSSLVFQYGAIATINHGNFKNVTLSTATNTTDLTVQNSTFTYDKDLNAPAVYVPEAKNVAVLNNSFVANNRTGLNGTSHSMIKFGQFAWTNHDAKVFGGSAIGNTITSNIKAAGIDTAEAGIGAPSFVVKDNILHKTTLKLTSNDINTNNQLLSE